MNDAIELHEAHLLSEGDWLHVEQLCRLTGLTTSVIVELVDLGALAAPRGGMPADWEMPATVLPRLRTVGRLMHDLGVNVSGAVLAVELLEAQKEMERRIRQLERLTGGAL
jgi:chaperone modulatory protein CbpM